MDGQTSTMLWTLLAVYFYSLAAVCVAGIVLHGIIKKDDE